MVYRVVQWGTGNVGLHSLRHLIRHPRFDLVGLHAHGESKRGRDAADIAGFTGEKTGVIATNDVDALLELKPDLVVYNANGELLRRCRADLSCILSAGVNVASTALIYLIYPPHADASMREPLEAACVRARARCS